MCNYRHSSAHAPPRRRTTLTPLAPFQVRSFRFQWPADLAASLAFEMEALTLGWYVLVATGSVELLVAFGALMWVGALFSPFFGMVGDRVGLRTLLCVTRGGYALLAAVLAALTLSDSLQPWHVFAIAGLTGLVRPSDAAMRTVLVGQTMRPEALMGALGISRTTSDVARIAGALAGAGGVALVGMGPAYVAITALYVTAFLFSLGVARPPLQAVHASAAATLAGLKDGVRYVWSKPELLGGFSITFLVNLLAFPFLFGLLPYAAKEIFDSGQSGLGYLAASFSAGALVASFVVIANHAPLRAGRVMLWSTTAWFVAMLLYGQTRSLPIGLSLLFVSGFLQTFCLLPVTAVMLRASSEDMRGRVIGMRMLAIWGIPLGLLAAGPIIASIGYAACTAVFSGLGLAATVAMGYRWRRALWHPSAAANSHL